MKKWLNRLLFLTVAYGLGLGQLPAKAQAQTSPHTAPLILNPTTIRHQLLESNLQILESLKQIQTAKDQVNIARGNLLPNFGGVLSLARGPSFIISSVTALLPFLMPSNWFALKQQRFLLEAQKIAARIMQLNTYASAAALYYQLVSDEATRQVYLRQADDLCKIAQIRKMDHELGIGSSADYQQSQAQAEMAKVQASRMNELHIQELASMRSALSLPLTSELGIEDVSMPKSPWEGQSLEGALTQAIQVSPESLQLQTLIQAARTSRWSTAFGFVNSTSISTSTNPSGGGTSGASFANLFGRVSLNLGFATYPTIQLTNHNIQEIQLRQQELQFESARVLESGMKSLIEAQTRSDLAQRAEAAMRQVYETRQVEYDLGTGSLLETLIARSQMSEASIQRIQTSLDMNLIRITLHRALLTDQFTLIASSEK